MAHKIEDSPTGRAACRGCKESIPRGALRFAEEFASPYSEDGGTVIPPSCERDDAVPGVRVNACLTGRDLDEVVRAIEDDGDSGPDPIEEDR
jgi:hypothetical protein